VEESNPDEVAAICEVLARLDARAVPREGRPPRILVITPYREQERALAQAVGKLRRERLQNLEVEICTFDRCQGREAEYVLLSLVRNRASVFLDAPKRWNVALTRAMEGLFIFGDIDAYLDEARKARMAVRRDPAARPRMSVVARVIEAYDRQIAELSTPAARTSR
jgi:hypothetical protein